MHTCQSVAAYGADPDYKVGEQLAIQEKLGSEGIAKRFVAPMLRRQFSDRGPEAVRVLDVGCGLGHTINALRELGYDAWGLEPGGRRHDADSRAAGFILPYFSQDLLRNRPDLEKFDMVMSHAVIEHVGTTDGNGDLAPDYRDYRVLFVNSQLDLLRPGGLLLLCGPNRLFPLDFQHGDHTYGVLGPLKRAAPMLRHVTIPWHKRNFLVSYGDMAAIARESGRRLTFLDEPQRGYSTMSQFRDRPRLQAAYRAYIASISLLPRAVRRPFETHTILVCRLDA
ncbi:MAG TPA: methyltransferase domain-containing protein [Acetobacteraceae bacterium]|nr:methyltransferase domain-containing protein [Acetobacteraceae bacterium]